MRLSIGEMADLSGVSVRTLHYYDEIGLLRPEIVTGAGYRYYGAASAARMQQILFYRELEFSLKDIRVLLSDPRYDKREALRNQQHLLQLKRDRLNRLLGLLEANLKGEKTMEFRDFDSSELDMARESYAAEAKARWGETEAWQESQRRMKKLTPQEREAQTEEMNGVFRRFAALAGRDPASTEVQAVLDCWQAFITEHYYPCTDEILAGLGKLYTADERFQQNLDRFGPGTAQLMSEAIAVRFHR